MLPPGRSSPRPRDTLGHPAGKQLCRKGPGGLVGTALSTGQQRALGTKRAGGTGAALGTVRPAGPGW